MEEEATAVVIDNGTYTCKAGFSGEDEPQCVVRTVVGLVVQDSEKQSYVGQKAIEKVQDESALRYPIAHGIIRNWEDMELVWQDIFQQLEVPSEEYPVLLTEVPCNPKGSREKMTEVMFEKFRPPAVYGAIRTVLPLYAIGEVTGVVLDIGEQVSHAVPIYEGYSLNHAIVRSDVCGSLICENLEELLRKSQESPQRSPLAGIGWYSQMALLHDMKEKHCYVSLDFSKESKKGPASPEVYSLPDGTEVHLGSERFCSTEILFQPKLAGSEGFGVHQLLVQAVKRSDADIQKALYSKIVLSGGTSLLPGLPERIEKEVCSLVSNSSTRKSVSVIAKPERKFSSWLGGSVLASLSTFQDMWVTKEEYEETGPAVIHRKCFI